MKQPIFTASQFMPTKHSSAEDKARFANHFVRFVEQDFKPTLFPNWFYSRLSCCFSHIAHFSREGFYATWFAGEHQRRDFLRRALRHPCHGSPEFTYCDVERELKRWIATSGRLAQFDAKIAASVELSERAELARLKAKYEPQREAA
jgi:hypothetical protein